MKLSLGQKAGLLIFLVLLIDQSVKFWIKTHMVLGQEYKVMGDWFIIHFTENPGMAFGMKFGGSFGKLLLSTFRILAVGGIGWYLVHLVKTKAHMGLILSISLILAGAVGNIIDSAFYGLLFDKGLIFDPSLNDWVPYFGQAQIGGPGYAGFLKGSVVDMLYFPIVQGHYPSWFPFVGSEQFVFFRPVFNIADSSITIGVIIILLFQKKFFKHQRESVE
ncbi:MAG TPA: lipoprotein signal peptidase [Bacteroidales bacterium]